MNSASSRPTKSPGLRERSITDAAHFSRLTAKLAAEHLSLAAGGIGGIFMKLIKGLKLYESLGDWIVLPTREVAAKTRGQGAFSISESGAVLWQMLEAGTDMESLIQRLIDEYDIDYETAFDDVGEFIHSLKETGLLE